VAVDGAMALIVILLIVQIWLLSATLEKLSLQVNTGAVPPASDFLRTRRLGMPGS